MVVVIGVVVAHKQHNVFEQPERGQSNSFGGGLSFGVKRGPTQFQLAHERLVVVVIGVVVAHTQQSVLEQVTETEAEIGPALPLAPPHGICAALYL